MAVEPFESDIGLLASVQAVRGTGPLAQVDRHELRKLFKVLNPTMKIKHGREMTGQEFRQIIYNLLGIWI